MAAMGPRPRARRLARLSVNNQLLVALSRPDARFVAGFKAWLELGYCVRKGEKAIRIVAPMPIKHTDDRDGLVQRHGRAVVQGSGSLRFGRRLSWRTPRPSGALWLARCFGDAVSDVRDGLDCWGLAEFAS
jgi:hypothetical protein